MKPKMRFAPKGSTGTTVPASAYVREATPFVGRSLDSVARRVPGPSIQVCRKVDCLCDKCKMGAKMNREALALLENARRIQAAGEVSVRVLPDGTRWVEAEPGDLKLGRDKHAKALAAALARKAAREEAEKVAAREAELAAKTRILKPGIRKDVRKEVKNARAQGSVRDTSVLGANKMFGTQGRWD